MIYNLNEEFKRIIKEYIEEDNEIEKSCIEVLNQLKTSLGLSNAKISKVLTVNGFEDFESEGYDSQYYKLEQKGITFYIKVFFNEEYNTYDIVINIRGNKLNKKKILERLKFLLNQKWPIDNGEYGYLFTFTATSEKEIIPQLSDIANKIRTLAGKAQPEKTLNTLDQIIKLIKNNCNGKEPSVRQYRDGEIRIEFFCDASKSYSLTNKISELVDKDDDFEDYREKIYDEENGQHYVIIEFWQEEDDDWREIREEERYYETDPDGY